jgi:flagellar hook-basal body complex protein FliE
MKITGIDSSQIQAMMAQLKAAAQPPSVDQAASFSMPNKVESLNQTTKNTDKVSFSDALKSSLDQVNKIQLESEKMGKEFAMGDDTVSLSDVMIAGQKANISFQATVQVRNKLVSAYSEIMNMQV